MAAASGTTRAPPRRPRPRGVRRNQTTPFPRSCLVHFGDGWTTPLQDAAARRSAGRRGATRSPRERGHVARHECSEGPVEPVRTVYRRTPSTPPMVRQSRSTLEWRFGALWAAAVGATWPPPGIGGLRLWFVAAALEAGRPPDAIAAVVGLSCPERGRPMPTWGQRRACVESVRLPEAMA